MNELDRIFGNDTDYTEMENVNIDKIKQNVKTQAINGGILGIPKEVADNYKNREWVEEQRRLRKEEEAIMYGGVSNKKESPMGGTIFTVDQTFYKARGLAERDVPHVLTSDYIDILNSSNSKQGTVIKTTINSRAAVGLQRSIRSISKNDEYYKHHEWVEFLKFVNAQNIDIRKIDDTLQAHLYQQFLQSKRLRIDVLIDQCIRIIDGVFMTELLSNNDMSVDAINDLQISRDKRLNMIKMIVSERGPLVPIEKFDILMWFFSRYGVSPVDKAYFVEGAMTIRGQLMTDLLAEFEAIAGFKFLELYKYHKDKYEANLKENNTNNGQITDNDTKVYDSSVDNIMTTGAKNEENKPTNEEVENVIDLDDM